VILRYANSTRRFVVELGGCPGVVLKDGTQLIFATSKLVDVMPILMSALEPVSGPPVLRTTSPVTTPVKPPPTASAAQRAVFLAGEGVAQQTGCEGCHTLGASGNNGPGPPLTHIGQRLTTARIEAALRNPTAPMPSFAGLARSSPKAFHDLVQFLAMLR
jgi:mono/diheme cytochrome c family protein